MTIEEARKAAEVMMAYADGKRLSISKRFEQDKNGVYCHTHIFDDGTEITFNF